jgi:hypothetical protein
MTHHGSTCLKGPRSRKRAHWRGGRTQSPQAAAVRAELVARIRREIAAGTYDTPEKLEIALARLFGRLDMD